MVCSDEFRDWHPRPVVFWSWWRHVLVQPRGNCGADDQLFVASVLGSRQVSVLTATYRETQLSGDFSRRHSLIQALSHGISSNRSLNPNGARLLRGQLRLGSAKLRSPKENLFSEYDGSSSNDLRRRISSSNESPPTPSPYHPNLSLSLQNFFGYSFYILLEKPDEMWF